jgi:hypothetical protein
MAMSGFADAVVAQDGKIQGTAIVRETHGLAKYSQGDKWKKLKRGVSGTRYRNTTVIHWRDARWFDDQAILSFESPPPSYKMPRSELPPGTTIQTGPDSYVYLNVNGLSSAVRIEADTTLQLLTMEREGSARFGDFTTVLDLKLGTILGSVKKVSGGSRYEIHTPHGTASIRGTDFVVTVRPSANKDYAVRFISLTGQVVVSAAVEDAPVVYALRTGEEWNSDWKERVGPKPAPPEDLQRYCDEVSVPLVGPP